MKNFETRNEMIKYYSQKIQNSNVLEIGIFQGEFFEFLLQECNPSMIDGVDLFYGNIGSGDVDGNNVVHTDMEFEYERLSKKYMDDARVVFHKCFSHEYLSNCDDDKYDLIYIDADHSYHAVKRDIELAFLKIKNKGFIMGHDYELNKNKCKNNWTFGTKKAVDEFCEKYNQEIISFAYDGCVSFCIQVNK